MSCLMIESSRDVEPEQTGSGVVPGGGNLIHTPAHTREGTG